MAVLLGLLNEKDLANQRVTTVGVQQVFRAIDESVAEHNRQLDALISLFAIRTTAFQTRYELAGATRSQPLDANGRARPIKSAGFYTVGFPLQGSGNAWGRNYRTSVKMTVGEVARLTALMQDGDSRWVRDHILAALFYENGTTPWTFTDDINGALSVYGLANGDTTTYAIMSGADSAATDDHVKGAAAITTAVFEDIAAELKEHPENAGEVIVFVPTASKATVEGLSTFYPVADPNVNQGANVTTLARSLNVATPGTLFGYVEGCWVYEWAGMPANYLLGTTVGGEPALAVFDRINGSHLSRNLIAEMGATGANLCYCSSSTRCLEQSGAGDDLGGTTRSYPTRLLRREEKHPADCPRSALFAQDRR